MFQDFLNSDQKIFKLVCGAGNECSQDAERLCALYSLAGCQVFDICAKPDILASAKHGLEIAGIDKNRYICVSVGIKGDPHTLKAKIDKSICIKCRKCEQICMNDAIKNHTVNTSKCIGCAKCAEVCCYGAAAMYETDMNLNKVLPPIISNGIDCIELHASSEFGNDINEKWGIITDNFNGIVSICIDRQNLGNKQLLSQIKRMIRTRKPYTTIIQADGIPMSGADDNYKTTLQSVAAGEIIQNAELPVYLVLSGGTNSKTAFLADLCGINYKGIAVGSWARKIVREFIKRDDFYDNKTIFNKALDRAKRLTETVISFL